MNWKDIISDSVIALCQTLKSQNGIDVVKQYFYASYMHNCLFIVWYVQSHFIYWWKQLSAFTVQSAITIGGSITVWLVSNWTGFDSAASRHTNNYTILVRYSPIMTNWRPVVGTILLPLLVMKHYCVFGYPRYKNGYIRVSSSNCF